MRIWLVLKVRTEEETGNPTTWEVQGIFSSEARAIEACKSSMDAYTWFKVDDELPQETVSPREWKFPTTNNEMERKS